MMTDKSVGHEKAGKRAAFAFVGFLILGVFVIFVASDSLYLWAKALHVIAVISWMAGLLYLPRLFINQIESEAEFGSDTYDLLLGMEQRLMRIIMTPAMIVSWVLGLYLAIAAGYVSDLWFVAKVILVVGLTVTHFWFAGATRKFRDNQNTLSAKQWRFINEVPTLLMIAIVIFVIVKPF